MRYLLILTCLFVVVLVLGACVPVPAKHESSSAPATSKPPMSEEEARKIAETGDCAQTGKLEQQAVYNDNSGTWWIDLDAEKPGCNPACVVDVKTKTAEVNWRCTGLKVEPTPAQGLANPASVNCTQQGGKLAIETGPDGGQYGVCTFPAGKQCEEWAMMRGGCPVGGVDVKGYTTDAARYCAITGGSYAATANVGAADEAGTCTLSGGKECDAGEYYAGKCRAE
jgi:putative hemolysin